MFKCFYWGLYFYGLFGVGKIYLFGGMVNVLVVKGFNMILIYFLSFVVEMKCLISNNMLVDKVDVIKWVLIFMIDDIGVDVLLIWIWDDVFGVILEY